MGERYGMTKSGIRIIDAWIGYTDGRPYIFRNEYEQREWCVFTNRADACKAFADVRRVRLMIAEGKNEGQK